MKKKPTIYPVGGIPCPRHNARSDTPGRIQTTTRPVYASQLSNEECQPFSEYVSDVEKPISFTTELTDSDRSDKSCPVPPVSSEYTSAIVVINKHVLVLLLR
jgi:hypothetical protein